MGLTGNPNPCRGVRKNKERLRNYYANDVIWDAVYRKAVPKLKDAMDLAYLTSQRPADVLSMCKSGIDGDYLLVKQAKTAHKVRILLASTEWKQVWANYLSKSPPGTSTSAART